MWSKWAHKRNKTQTSLVSFKSKRKLLVKEGGFLVPLVTSILLGEIGALINNDSN
jgi:hypothetical protein